MTKLNNHIQIQIKQTVIQMTNLTTKQTVVQKHLINNQVILKVIKKVTQDQMVNET
ncbi:hypothetical protein ACQKKJ_15615 [Staphylococcus cohnii]